MIWYDSEINKPPTNCLILVTSGIAWRREDEVIPPLLGKYKQELRAEYTRTSRKEIGGVRLVYWYPVEKTDPYIKDLYPGYWQEFGGGIGPREFKFWAEFNNPVGESLENSVHSIMIPDVKQMPVYIPSSTELENRKLRKMLGF